MFAASTPESRDSECGHLSCEHLLQTGPLAGLWPGVELGVTAVQGILHLESVATKSMGTQAGVAADSGSRTSGLCSLG